MDAISGALNNLRGYMIMMMMLTTMAYGAGRDTEGKAGNLNLQREKNYPCQCFFFPLLISGVMDSIFLFSGHR